MRTTQVVTTADQHVTDIGDGIPTAMPTRLRRLPDLNGAVSHADFIGHVPIAFARQHQLVGISAADEHPPMIAMADARSLQVADIICRRLAIDFERVITPALHISNLINHAYQQQQGQAQAVIESLDRTEILREVQALGEREDLLDIAARAPVIKLVNMLLFEAVKLEASDVHLQPYEDRLLVRIRLDGVLFDAFELPKPVQEQVISRIKIMGRMNIAEKRLAQDGRATVQVGDRFIDLRVSTVPASHGERVVIRLLDKSLRLYTLDELGMPPLILDRFTQLITVEHGLLLVTGPTGSGKSTTLYAALQQLNSRERNILTLEDPIEYQLQGISQIQVSQRKGMTFVSGLRSVLRQDPDIVMVGEIRDHETAAMAIQSALTGHLVFSTLHTNDAASAVMRLLDLGVEPYLAASSLIGVLAQRLVRCVCAECATDDTPSEATRSLLGPVTVDVHTMRLRRGAGCTRCRGTGFRGRKGLFELMAIDESIRGAVAERGTASAIQRRARRAGMKTLRDDGMDKVVGGMTTAEEVLRVTMQNGSMPDLDMAEQLIDEQ